MGRIWTQREKLIGEGGVLDQITEQGVLRNWSTKFALPLPESQCITDSLSHTMCVESKEKLLLSAPFLIVIHPTYVGQQMWVKVIPLIAVHAQL